MTTYHSSHAIAAQKIIDQVGKTIIIAVPLGIGKPIGFLNALYQLALQDKTIQLTIITGLTLARPNLKNELEKRLVEPILDRLLKDYEDPLYEQARLLQQLPSNIRVIEFFLTPGKYLHNSNVQQNYINSNYTTVTRDTLNFSVNVIASQVAQSSQHAKEYSLSSNSDLFLQVAEGIRINERAGKKIAIVAEVNLNLPFMYGDSVVKQTEFTDIIDSKKYPALFATPREKISYQDHLIGLYTSTLIEDDSSLQIGIGRLSNAVANALIMRHQENNAYQDMLDKLGAVKKFGKTMASTGSLDPFTYGLYASTEMLSDEYLQLYNAKILKKRVYDHVGLQILLNEKKITDDITPDIIDILLTNKLIHKKIKRRDFDFLQEFGILNQEVSYQRGEFVFSSGQQLPANLALVEVKKKLITECLGKKLQTGKIIHAGFFLGSVELYKQLKNMSFDELQLINMTTIARTNDLSFRPELLKLQRKQARFVNAAMMVSLGGVIISDGLRDMQEVSGVGGQFDFVLMAQKLEGARSIINCHSVRKHRNKTLSNIVWQYPNVTIPRHLRDIVVTEYGIADCRSKTDAEIIQAMLNITDSRFQPELLKQAKKAGKLAKEYKIPAQFSQNFPERVQGIVKEFQHKGYCKPYPFGNDLTDEEMVIADILMYLKNCGKFKLGLLVFLALIDFRCKPKALPYLQRMNLVQTRTVKEFIYKRLLQRLIK
ncbi:MAG: acetyl-CoA hydrolase/transferase C-terminal domain-containing protein [Gammaproteobacteria bacterium]